MNRRPLDAYYTPDEVASQLVGTLGLGMRRGLEVLEPSVGGGAFVRALRSVDDRCSITGIDCDPSAAGLPICDETWVGDFATYQGGPFDLVVGNPPYRDAEAHVRHALTLAPTVAFLLRLAFLESQSRYPLWRDHPASEVFVLSRRPSFTGGGTDATAYAFFIWRRHRTISETVLRVLPPTESGIV